MGSPVRRLVVGPSCLGGAVSLGYQVATAPAGLAPTWPSSWPSSSWRARSARPPDKRHPPTVKSSSHKASGLGCRVADGPLRGTVADSGVVVEGNSRHYQLIDRGQYNDCMRQIRVSPERFRQLRENVGMSARALARLIGTSPQQIWRLDSGRSTSINFLVRLVPVFSEDSVADAIVDQGQRARFVEHCAHLRTLITI
ncbi:helix-turn-helix domain-containing protein [Streptosporangium sp. NPDC050284]|uniref:helix-turn-helix domain-containing protein n=2 Tax=Streptosporangium TaxID=2000 RepID=UPI0037B7BD06